MFDAIAPKYDLVNRVISLGIDQSWRRKTVAALELRQNARVLDLATGTGDLALQVLDSHPDAHVVGVDPSGEMLEVGKSKAGHKGLGSSLELVQGDAQALELETDSFDGVCMAFGIRNVPDRGKALAEMARVTCPGGRIAILELSEPRSGLFGPLARFHIHTVVPWVGSVLSGAQEYRYLERSIAAFPPPEEFAELMTHSGVEVLQVQPLTFGVCCLFVGTPAGRSLA